VFKTRKLAFFLVLSNLALYYFSLIKRALAFVNVLKYSSQERKIFLTKLIIPEEVTAEDFKEQFIKSVLNIIQEKNLRVVPTSPQIAGFLRKNRQYKELLPVGIRI